MVSAVLELIFAVICIICKIIAAVYSLVCYRHFTKTDDKQDKIIDLLHVIFFTLIAFA